MTEFTSPAPEPHRFSIGNVVSQTFNIYFRNFFPFFVLAFVVNLPSLFTQLWMQNADPSDMVAVSAGGFLVNILNGLLNLIVTGAILYGVYQQMRNRPFDLRRALNIAGSRLLAIIGVSIISGFIIFVGFILLVIPGIILALMLLVSVPATVVERVGPIDALARSRELTEGHRLEILGLLVLLWAFALIISMVMGVVVAFVIEQGTAPTAFTVTMHAISVAANVAQAVGLGVLYYELRRTKEGLDLNDLATVFE